MGAKGTNIRVVVHGCSLASALLLLLEGAHLHLSALRQCTDGAAWHFAPTLLMFLDDVDAFYGPRLSWCVLLCNDTLKSQPGMTQSRTEQLIAFNVRARP